MKIKSVLFFFLFLSFVFCFAQTGTLKVFCELTEVDIYIDDVYQGRDIKMVEKLKPGSYYLKVIKDKATIFGEIIEIKPDLTTSVLIKNSDAVQKKILESKSDEIAKYKEQKIVLALMQSGDVSIKINNLSLSKERFLEIVGDESVLESMRRAKKRSSVNTCIAVPLAIGGGVYYIYGIVMAALKNPILPGANTDFWTYAIHIGLGASAFITGMVLPIASGGGNSLSWDYAKKKADEYNANLKKKLNLPLEFETSP